MIMKKKILEMLYKHDTRSRIKKPGDVYKSLQGKSIFEIVTLFW